MTVEQRIELLRGGYTPEQIEGFENDSQPTKQEVQPEAQPQEQPEAQPQEQPKEQPQEQPEYSNADVMNAIAGLKSLIQASNIASSFIPQVKETSAADVLAQVIRPERKV